jgi:quercetin dioxygenase-like cupin family protein
MLKEREVTYGQLRIMIYDFEYKDDLLVEHSHTRDDVHITVCVRGEVEAVFNDKTLILKEGNIIEFFPGQTHAIKALTDNSRIMNIPIHYV